MSSIRFYPSKRIDSKYIEALEEKGHRLFSLDEKEITEEKNAAIVLDYTEETSEESIKNLCDFFTNENEESPFVFILLKKATRIERLILLQLGATIVFDQQVDPKEFALIVSKLLKPMTEQPQTKLTEVRSKTGIQLMINSLSIRLSDGREVSLTPLEYKLIDFLYEKNQQVQTYEEIGVFMWGEDKKSNRYLISNLVFHIRKKIEPDGSQPIYLKTVRTVGYVLCHGK